MTRRLGSCLAAAAFLVLAACGNESPTTTGSDRDSADLPGRFAEPRVTWAQGTTLHYGGDDYRLPAPAVAGLWRTTYGFIVTLHEPGQDGSGGRLHFFDGRKATPLEGDPVGVAVSPDGRYAGWLDYDGPDREGGRLAEAVVTDLRTGREVFRNHDDMGDDEDDLSNLYEDAGQGFLGFDDDYAYWNSAEGTPTSKRARIGTWKVEPAASADVDGPPPPGHPYDAMVGRESGTDDDGTLSDTGEGLLGLGSPNGRWCLTTGDPGRLPVVDCRTARRVTPAYPGRKSYFAGWTGPDSYAVVSSAREVLPPEPTSRPTPGTIVECTLPSGACRLVARSGDVRTMVNAVGDVSMTG